MTSVIREESKRFPLTARVRSSQDYTDVFQRAERYAHPLLRLHHLHLPRPARLGLVVSRKVDRRAINRNRIKRILRETMRHHRLHLPQGDYVVVARVAARQASNIQLRTALMNLLKRISALSRPRPSKI